MNYPYNRAWSNIFSIVAPQARNSWVVSGVFGADDPPSDQIWPNIRGSSAYFGRDQTIPPLAAQDFDFGRKRNTSFEVLVQKTVSTALKSLVMHYDLL